MSEGALNGKNTTCIYAIKNDVIKTGAKFMDKKVVVDGNLITSRNSYDLPVFCKKIANFLRSV